MYRKAKAAMHSLAKFTLRLDNKLKLVGKTSIFYKIYYHKKYAFSYDMTFYPKKKNSYIRNEKSYLKNI